MFRNIFAILVLLMSPFYIKSQICDAGEAITGTHINVVPVCTNVASMVPPFTGSVPGLVPTSPGGTNNFLRSDGTWSAAVFSYPSAGIANSTGAAWGASYSTSGSGTTIALTNGPTFTTVTANNYIGQFSPVYGTLALGSGSGGTIEKTVSDATAVFVASQNGATTGTGDYYAAKDSSGSLHTIVDHSLGIWAPSISIGYTGALPVPYPFTLGTTGQFHSDAVGNVRAATFNGVGLTTSGSSSSYLDATGNYSTPSNSPSYPFSVSDGTSLHGSLSISSTGSELGNTNGSNISIDSGTNSILLGATGAGNIEIFTDASGDGAVQFNSSPSMPGLQVAPTNGASVALATVAGTSGRFTQNFSAVNGVITTVQTTTTIPAGDLTAWNGTQLVDGGKSACPAGKPTATAGPGAGTSGTPGITIVGTNCDFQIQLTTSSAPASGQNILLITYANPFTSYSGCQKELDQNSLEDPGGPSMYLAAGYNNRVYLNAGTTALAALTNHTIWFHCGGN